MYITPDPDTLWPCRPFERDTPVTDGWMFFCFVVQTLVSPYSCLITPRGPKNDWQWAFLTFLLQECSLLRLQGIWWHQHASYPGGRHKVSSWGVFWSPKKAGSFRAKVTVMIHRAPTHFEWTCWCMYVMVSVAPDLKPVYLGFEVKISVVNGPLHDSGRPIID